MLKILLAAVMLTAAAQAEDKPAEKKTFALTADQLARIENITLRAKPVEDAINLLYQAVMAPINAERKTVYAAICAAVKIPETECMIDLEKREVKQRDPVPVAVKK